MYRIVLIPIALLLLLIFAVMLIPLIADKETILDIATSALQKETGATLTVAGDTEVTIFPILGNLSVRCCGGAAESKNTTTCGHAQLKLGWTYCPC